MSEGFVEATGGRVWYRIAGEVQDRACLLCLHGGPGFTHDSVSSLEALADERQVVFYDQLGSGRSDRPEDPSLYRVERYVDEVMRVRDELGLARVHLFGHSWGGGLALAYALAGHPGIESLVLASPLISTDRWLKDARRLRSELPEDVRGILARHEESGHTGCPEYVAATMAFYRRHLCRLESWPEELERAFAGMGLDVYETMWGPTEFHATGTLLDLDLEPRLGELQVPVLFTCGRHDEASPETVGSFRDAVDGAELEVFEDSSHTAHLEERDRYLQVLRRYLNAADRTAA
jgi:proline iminopeptidase